MGWYSRRPATRRPFEPCSSSTPRPRFALVYYPLSNGRNFQELKRLLIAMQTSDAFKCATPADWQPGDDVIVPPPGSCGAARDRVDNAGKDYYCLDWFLCFKKLPKSQLNLP